MYLYHASYRFPSEVVLFLELGLTLIAILWFFLIKRSAPGGRIRRIGWSFLRRASRPAHRTTFLLGVSVFALSSLYSGFAGYPIPAVSDELGHLLNADTLADFRWVNPVPPIPEYFEAEHVILDPVYISKYPPGIGALLGFGQIIGGHPGFGVSLGAGLLAGIAFWSVAAFFPPPWPLIAALVVALRFSLGSYWGHSYWGGAVAAAAAFLLFGAARRLIRSIRVGPAVVLAVSLIALAHTRPWEGLAVSLVVALPIVALLINPKIDIRAKVVGLLVPFGLVLLLLGTSIPLHNDQVSGDPLVFPDIHYRHLQGVDSIFTFVRPVADRAAGQSAINYRAFHPAAVAPTFANMLSRVLNFHLGLPLLICLLLGLSRRPPPWALWTAGSLLLCVLFLTFDSWGVIPHYTAPALPASLLLAIAGLRSVSLRLRAKGGLQLPILVLAVYIAGCLVQLPAWRQDPEDWTRRRHQILQELSEEPGQQILIVPDEFRTAVAYIYNRADWEQAEVLMARDLGPETVFDLSREFPDHQLWLLEPHPRLSWPTHRRVKKPNGIR